MNQLEYFLASTEGSRADVMRYMQRLRDLDEWIEHHLTQLRALTASRVMYLSSDAHRGGRERGRGRGRGRGAGRAAGFSASSRRLENVNGDRSDGASWSGAGDETVAAAEVYAVELQRAFEWHEACVRQHCQEREVLAAELAERCAEVRLSMASRLANFASVADVPVTELSS